MVTAATVQKTSIGAAALSADFPKRIRVAGPELFALLTFYEQSLPVFVSLGSRASGGSLSVCDGEVSFDDICGKGDHRHRGQQDEEALAVREHVTTLPEDWGASHEHVWEIDQAPQQSIRSSANVPSSDEVKVIRHVAEGFQDYGVFEFTQFGTSPP